MVAGALALVVSTALPAFAVDPNHVRIGLTRVGSGLGFPTALTFPVDGTGRIFMIERSGLIRVRIPGGFASKPFLDIRSRVKSGGEQGMLGMAFHPGFRTNGVFYVSYTDSAGSLRVSRFRASPPSSNVASTYEFNNIRIPHPSFTNHNAGQLNFGTDGFLYISTGDGGSGGDPNGNAQNLNSLLGKILRIDIKTTCGSLNYCIPGSNPFVGVAGRDEIWEYGLRNPWKWSFDRTTHEMYVADVGQGAREEITQLPASPGGKNLGWDCREGTLNTVSQYGGSYCNGQTFTAPFFEYSHASGRCAIIGGYVYRGSTYSAVMGGMYVYADYCTGEIFGIAQQSGGNWVNARVRQHTTQITTFGESQGGEIFMGDANGNIYRLSASSV